MRCVIVILLIVLILILTSSIENFSTTHRPFIDETISNKSKFKEIIGALSTLDNISGYKYRVGGSDGGSYDSMGFKENELEKVYYPHVFRNGGLKTANKDVISNEKMVPVIAQALKDINKLISSHVDSINIIYNYFFVFLFNF